MSRVRVAGLIALGALGMVGADCGTVGTPLVRPPARVASTLPGSCDGFADYAGELAVASVRPRIVVGAGIGTVDVQIDLSLRNEGIAPFRSASALPDLASAAASELGLLAEGVFAADFPAIAPGATASSTAPLQVRLPADRYMDFLDRIADGSLPFVVHADEENVLAAGVEIVPWTATEDAMYALAAQDQGGFGMPLNEDPGDGPFLPGQAFAIGLLFYSDDLTTVFSDFEPGDRLYVVEDPAAPPVNLPDAYDQVRVVAVERFDEENDGVTFYLVTLKRTDDEALPEIFANASFCTGTTAHVDPPVQATRTFALDGNVVPDEERESHGQPLRMNGFRFSEGVVTVSGQIAGHVLKPSLSLRLREGHVETGVSFDTDVSFAAEVRAEEDAELAPEDVELWRHCFPLPNLPAGPVSIPMNLQLVHSIGMSGSVAAGLVTGISKHFESGFGITCRGGPGVPETCESAGYRNPTPIDFTPPHLTDATGAEMRVETTLDALLRIGSPHPVCDTGPGLSLTTTAYAAMSLAPTQEPWWSSGYGLEVEAAVDLEILGLDVARYETELAAWEDGASSSDALPEVPGEPGARTMGRDQRWAVAIDQVAVGNGVDASDVALLPDGSALAVATEPVLGRNPIVKLDREGALVWVKNFPRKVHRVHALPDGTAVAAGSANAWIVRVDADGNLLWSFDAEIGRTSPATARCSLRDVAAIETAPGVYDFVAVGVMGTGLVTTVDGCAFRVDADGTLAWSRIYVGDRGQTFAAAIATRDGEIAVVGSDNWNAYGNRLIPLIAKLDAETGDVVWWKVLPMTRYAELAGVIEAADGTLFAVGSAQRIIWETGSALVARIASDGSDARHALLFEDAAWEELLDYEAWVDTAGGESPYDRFDDIAASGDGFVIAGRTGLGVETAARVAKINRNLGVEWFTTFDGPFAEGLSGVAVAPDGVFVSGASASLPEADGGTGESQLLVMKLPFTGSVELLPEVDMTVRYVAPGVRFSSADPGVNPFGDPAIELVRTLEAGLPVSSGPNAALLGTAGAYCVEVLTETGAPSLLDACAD